MENEKIAHELAVLYEIVSAVSPDCDYSRQDLYSCYKQSFDEFMDLLSNQSSE